MYACISTTVELGKDYKQNILYLSNIYANYCIAFNRCAPVIILIMITISMKWSSLKLRQDGTT